MTASDYGIDADTGAYRIGTQSYVYSHPTIYRNGEKLSDHIAEFTLTPIEDGEQLVGIDIKVEGQASDQAGEKAVETTIYFRR